MVVAPLPCARVNSVGSRALGLGLGLGLARLASPGIKPRAHAIDPVASSALPPPPPSATRALLPSGAGNRRPSRAAPDATDGPDRPRERA